MQTEEWRVFEQTGKVMDYLRYCQREKAENHYGEKTTEKENRKRQSDQDTMKKDSLGM